jgi:iron complex outermembrane receptor protein
MSKQAWIMAALLGAGTVSAQETVRTNASEIVVTATRDKTEASRTPVSISVITAEDIDRKGANNLSDVLRDVPGVQIRSLSGGPIAEAAMRGGGENSQGRVLVLLDGRRLNNPDMSSMNWLQIPLNLVDRVEVLRGSQTALYGDFASEGVINIITKKGSAKPAAEVSLIGASDDTSIARAGVSGTSGGPLPVSVAANAEWETSDGYRDRSGHESYGAGGRLSSDFSDRTGAAIAGSWYRSYYELPGDLTRQEMKDNPRQSHNPEDDSDNDYLNANLDYYAEPVDGMRLEAGLGWLEKKTEGNVASWFMFSDTDLDSYSVQPRMTVDGAWGGLNQRTLVGTDLYWDRMDVVRYSDAARTSRTIDAELEKDTVGGFLRHQVELSPEWIVHGAVRVEQATLGADAEAGGVTVVDESSAHHGSAWEGGLVYAFDQRSKAFTRVGSVYRYPFVDEQISYYGFGTDDFYRELEAEKGLNTEAGLELGWDPRWRASATLFRLEMRDEVAWDPIANRNANLDETRRQGAELAGGWKPLDRVELEASYTVMEAEFTSGVNDGNEVPLVPEHLATGLVRIGLPADLWLDATVRYTGESPLGGDVGNAGPELDAYTTLDLALRYRPASGFTAFVGVDNVTDEAYAAVAYKGFSQDGYYPSPGQTWRAGVSKRF